MSGAFVELLGCAWAQMEDHLQAGHHLSSVLGGCRSRLGALMLALAHAAAPNQSAHCVLWPCVLHCHATSTSPTWPHTPAGAPIECGTLPGARTVSTVHACSHTDHPAVAPAQCRRPLMQPLLMTASCCWWCLTAWATCTARRLWRRWSRGCRHGLGPRCGTGRHQHRRGRRQQGGGLLAS